VRESLEQSASETIRVINRVFSSAIDPQRIASCGLFPHSPHTTAWKRTESRFESVYLFPSKRRQQSRLVPVSLSYLDKKQSFQTGPRYRSTFVPDALGYPFLPAACVSACVCVIPRPQPHNAERVFTRISSRSRCSRALHHSAMTPPCGRLSGSRAAWNLTPFSAPDIARVSVSVARRRILRAGRR